MRVDSVIPEVSSDAENGGVISPVGQADSKVAIYSERVMEWALLAILVLAPSIFSFVNADIFELPKAVMLRVFTITIIAVWVLKTIQTGEFRLVRTKADLPLLLYLLLVCLASLASASPVQSLIGDFDRDDGLLVIINYALVFWMTVNVYQKREQVWRAVKWQVVVAAGVAAYGIAQIFNIGVFGNYWELWPGGRAASTLANPTFLSTFLAMIIPLDLVLFTRAKEPRERLLWGAITIVLTFALILTYGRSGWVGVLAACGFMSLALGWHRQLKNKFVLLSFASLLALFVGYFFVIPSALPNAPSLPGQFSVRQRLEQTLLQPGNDVRVYYWQGAVQIIKENWLIGVGVANFQDSFLKFSSVDYARGEGFRAAPDKAHNEYLNIAAVSGLPSLFFYLWFLGGIAWLVLKKWRLLRNEPLVTALFASFIANNVAMLFLFNSVGEAPLFWWSMGATVALIGIDRKFSWVSSKRLILSSSISTVLSISVVVAAILLSFHLVVRPLVADYYVREGDKLLSKTEELAPKLENYSEEQLSGIPAAHGTGHSGAGVEKAIRLYQDALDLWPYQAMYWVKYSSILQAAGGTSFSENESRRYLDDAVSAANQAMSLRPATSSIYLVRGSAYIGYGQEHISDALNDYRKAVSLAPYYYDSQVALARLTFQLGALNEAVAAMRRVVEIKPDDWQTWFNLSQGYLNSGRYPAAEKAILTFLAANPEDVPGHVLLGQTYFMEGNIEAARSELQRALELAPNDENAQRSLDRVNMEQKTPTGPISSH